MMDMNALILTANSELRAVGLVADPDDVAAFLEQLRRVLLAHPASDRGALIQSLSAILKLPGNVLVGGAQLG